GVVAGVPRDGVIDKDAARVAAVADLQDPCGHMVQLRVGQAEDAAQSADAAEDDLLRGAEGLQGYPPSAGVDLLGDVEVEAGELDIAVIAGLDAGFAVNRVDFHEDGVFDERKGAAAVAGQHVDLVVAGKGHGTTGADAQIGDVGGTGAERSGRGLRDVSAGQQCQNVGAGQPSDGSAHVDVPGGAAADVQHRGGDVV